MCVGTDDPPETDSSFQLLIYINFRENFMFKNSLRIIASVLAASLIALSICGCDSGKTDSKPEENEMSNNPASTLPDPGVLNDTVYAEIEMENGGVIKLELYHNVAPITVENFVALARDGFYDGLIFHRVIAGFMIQGGDPLGTGLGGSKDNIKGEFSKNGVENNISHVRGVISMARRGHPYYDELYYDTASSQFFIVHADSTYLDGSYAAFGRVTEGMDVVDRIAAVPTDSDNKPLEEQKIKTIRIIK